MICPDCGVSLRDDVRFCTNCGRSFVAATATAPTAAAVQPAVPVPDAMAAPASAPAEAAYVPLSDSSRSNSGLTLMGLSDASPQTDTAVPIPQSPRVDSGAPPSSLRYLTFGILAVLALATIATVGIMLWKPKPSNVAMEVEQPFVQTTVGATVNLAVLISTSDLDDAIVWTVQEPNAGSVESTGVAAQNGRIKFTAVYHAPARIGTFHVTAALRSNASHVTVIAVDVK